MISTLVNVRFRISNLICIVFIFNTTTLFCQNQVTNYYHVGKDLNYKLLKVEDKALFFSLNFNNQLSLYDVSDIKNPIALVDKRKIGAQASDGIIYNKDFIIFHAVDHIYRFNVLTLYLDSLRLPEEVEWEDYRTKYDFKNNYLHLNDNKNNNYLVNVDSMALENLNLNGYFISMTYDHMIFGNSENKLVYSYNLSTREIDTLTTKVKSNYNNGQSKYCTFLDTLGFLYASDGTSENTFKLLNVEILDYKNLSNDSTLMVMYWEKTKSYLELIIMKSNGTIIKPEIKDHDLYNFSQIYEHGNSYIFDATNLIIYNAQKDSFFVLEKEKYYLDYKRLMYLDNDNKLLTTFAEKDTFYFIKIDLDTYDTEVGGSYDVKEIKFNNVEIEVISTKERTLLSKLDTYSKGVAIFSFRDDKGEIRLEKDFENSSDGFSHSTFYNVGKSLFYYPNYHVNGRSLFYFNGDYTLSEPILDRGNYFIYQPILLNGLIYFCVNNKILKQQQLYSIDKNLKITKLVDFPLFTHSTYLRPAGKDYIVVSDNPYSNSYDNFIYSIQTNKLVKLNLPFRWLADVRNNYIYGYNWSNTATPYYRYNILTDDYEVIFDGYYSYKLILDDKNLVVQSDYYNSPSPSKILKINEDKTSFELGNSSYMFICDSTKIVVDDKLIYDLNLDTTVLISLDSSYFNAYQLDANQVFLYYNKFIWQNEPPHIYTRRNEIFDCKTNLVTSVSEFDIKEPWHVATKVFNKIYGIVERPNYNYLLCEMGDDFKINKIVQQDLDNWNGLKNHEFDISNSLLVTNNYGWHFNKTSDTIIKLDFKSNDSQFLFYLDNKAIFLVNNAYEGNQLWEYQISETSNVISEPKQIKDLIKISPNPVSDILRIHDNIDFSGVIIDVFGKTVKTFLSTQSGIDVHNLTPGIYFIKSRSNTILAKFIKI